MTRIRRRGDAAFDRSVNAFLITVLLVTLLPLVYVVSSVSHRSARRTLSSPRACR